MALEADFADLLTRLACSDAPFARVGDWFDVHEEMFADDRTSTELRSVVLEALAVCWSVRRRYATDAAARAQLRRLASLLDPAAVGCPELEPGWAVLTVSGQPVRLRHR
jgi:hypothetical protein